MTPLLSSLGQAKEKQKPVFSLTHHYPGVIPYSLQNLKVPIIAECQGPRPGISHGPGKCILGSLSLLYPHSICVVPIISLQPTQPPSSFETLGWSSN